VGSTQSQYDQKENIMKTPILFSAFIATTMILFSGCVSKMQAPQNSGFFKNYEQFQNNSQTLSKMGTLSKDKKIYVQDVTVLSAIPQQEQTIQQKKLYKEISTYATNRLKEALKFTNSEKRSKDVLIMKSAISACEVHFEDKQWNQLSPLALGITVVSLNAYLDESVRLVGEYRIENAHDTLIESLHQVKDLPLTLSGDNLTLDDLKAPIDQWVQYVVSHIYKGVK